MSKKDFKKILGAYSDCYIGQSIDREIREKGSSGGCLTSLLLALIENNLVEGIIAVGWDKNYPQKPKLKCLATEKEIKEAAGSKYIRVPVKETLNIIEENKDKRLAVVAHPCTISVLRKINKENVKFLIGFFCGWCMDWRATEYLLDKLKINRENIKSINYRGGEYPGGFRAELKDGTCKQLPKDLYDYLNLAFLARGCEDCHFYTNEEADISFGDFWHKDFKRYSTIIVRNDVGEKLFNLFRERIKFETISPEEIVKSHKGNLYHKRIKQSSFKNTVRKVLKDKRLPLKLMLILTSVRRKIILWKKTIFGRG